MENVIQRPSLFCLPVWLTKVRVETGFSKYRLPAPLSPSPLCSCHSDPLPEPHCSSDLTSLAISCLLLSPADSTPAQVMHLYYIIVQKLLSMSEFFVWSVPVCLKWKDQRPESTGDNRNGSSFSLRLYMFTGCVRPGDRLWLQCYMGVTFRKTWFVSGKFNLRWLPRQGHSYQHLLRLWTELWT